MSHHGRPTLLVRGSGQRILSQSLLFYSCWQEQSYGVIILLDVRFFTFLISVSRICIAGTARSRSFLLRNGISGIYLPILIIDHLTDQLAKLPACLISGYMLRLLH